jgi:two-component system, chemotaxis family, chemotaxis protein CheY
MQTDFREKGLLMDLFSLRKHRKHNVVLVADDDIFIRKTAAQGLHGLTTTREVAYGEEIVQAYEMACPNMVLLDIHFPNYYGLNAIKPILERDPNAYIVVLSADAVANNIEKALFLGAKGFMVKPFSRQTLIREFNRCPSIVFDDGAVPEIL